MTRESFKTKWYPKSFGDQDMFERDMENLISKEIQKAMKQFKEGIAAVIYDLEQLSCK